MPHIKLTSEQFQAALSEYLSTALPSALLNRVSKCLYDASVSLGNDSLEGNAIFADHFARVSREIDLLSHAARAEETRVGTDESKSPRCQCRHRELAHLIGADGRGGTGVCPVRGCSCQAFSRAK